MRTVRGKADSDRSTETVANNVGSTADSLCLYQTRDVLCGCLDRKRYVRRVTMSRTVWEKKMVAMDVGYDQFPVVSVDKGPVYEENGGVAVSVDGHMPEGGAWVISCSFLRL